MLRGGFAILHRSSSGRRQQFTAVAGPLGLYRRRAWGRVFHRVGDGCPVRAPRAIVLRGSCGATDFQATGRSIVAPCTPWRRLYRKRGQAAKKTVGPFFDRLPFVTYTEYGRSSRPAFPAKTLERHHGFWRLRLSHGRAFAQAWFLSPVTASRRIPRAKRIE